MSLLAISLVGKDLGGEREVLERMCQCLLVTGNLRSARERLRERDAGTN